MLVIRSDTKDRRVVNGYTTEYILTPIEKFSCRLILKEIIERHKYIVSGDLNDDSYYWFEFGKKISIEERNLILEEVLSNINVVYVYDPKLYNPVNLISSGTYYNEMYDQIKNCVGLQETDYNIISDQVKEKLEEYKDMEIYNAGIMAKYNYKMYGKKFGYFRSFNKAVEKFRSEGRGDHAIVHEFQDGWNGVPYRNAEKEIPHRTEEQKETDGFFIIVFLILICCLISTLNNGYFGWAFLFFLAIILAYIILSKINN